MEAEEFIDNILNNYKTKLPNYIKLLLNYAGYDNIISISTLDDTCIKELERFAKEDLTKLLNENELYELFGKIYHRNPSLFKIADGHKKLLLHLKEICVKEVENISNKSNSKCDKKNSPCKEKSQKKRNFNDIQKEAEEMIENDTNIENNAKEHVENLAKKYVKKCIDENCEEHIEDFTEKIDNLKVKIDNQNYCAKIKCCFCDFISTGYSAKNSKSGRKWILSNFNKHILTHMKNKKHKKNYNPNNTLHSFLKIPQKTLKSNDNSLPSSLQSEDEIQNKIDISTEITSDTNSLANTIQNAEIYILPSIDSTELKECLASSSINSQAMSEEQNETYCGEIRSLLESDFCQGRIVEEANNSATQNNEPQIKTNGKVETVTRLQRKQKEFEIFDKSQTKITDYFLKTITTIIEDHPDVQNTLLNITNVENTNKFSNISSFLDCLRDTAAKNIRYKKHGNKFTEPLKLFSLYIFIVGGRLLYELLHANLQNILPSITTINRCLDKESNIVDGVVRLEELKLFLTKRNYPLNVFISEDQTAIIKNVAYDSKSNRMIGFVSSCKEHVFPKNNFYVNSVKDIENAFTNYVVGCNAYVYMAQPLIDNAPAFCLTVFASDNKFTHNDVLARWMFLKNELEKLNIQVTGFSSDGDTRCLKAMKIWSKISLSSKNPYSPYFQMEFDVKKPVCIQDTVHIGTKIKTRFLKPNVFLPMGSKIVSPEHVKKLITQYSKDKHLLCISDLEPKDKMNFDAVEKLCAVRVTELLSNISDSQSTKQFLILIKHILNSFLNKKLKIEERIYFMWYATFFLRLWRKWLQENNYSIDKNFISSNAYTCIELNAHGLILLIEKLRESNQSSFTPWLCSSQPCEKIFRQIRSMTSTFSTVVNFNLLGILRRLNRLQILNEISTDLRGTFQFPREENNRLGISSDNVPIFNFDEIPSIEQILNILNTAKNDAMNIAIELGMIMSEEKIKESFEKINIRHLTDEENKEKVENENDIEQNNEGSAGEDFEEDLENLENDISIFKSQTELNLKDYSTHSVEKNKGLFLNVQINEKKYVVRKSSVCWLYQNKNNLSSDRLYRVRGMNIANRNINVANKNEKSNELKIECEKYYCVYYDTGWYIGRILHIQQNICKIKFLCPNLHEFRWPKKDDIQNVDKKFIIYGPIVLNGTNPFTINKEVRIEIQKKFKQLKNN